MKSNLDVILKKAIHSIKGCTIIEIRDPTDNRLLGTIYPMPNGIRIMSKHLTEIGDLGTIAWSVDNKPVYGVELHFE